MKFSWESGSVIRWRGEDQYSDYMICIYSHAQDHMFVVYFRSNQIGRGEAWADAIALVKKHHNDQQKQKTITYQWQDYGAGRFALMKNIDEATTTCLGTVRFDFQAEQFSAERWNVTESKWDTIGKAPTCSEAKAIIEKLAKCIENLHFANATVDCNQHQAKAEQPDLVWQKRWLTEGGIDDTQPSFLLSRGDVIIEKILFYQSPARYHVRGVNYGSAQAAWRALRELPDYKHLPPLPE